MRARAIGERRAAAIAAAAGELASDEFGEGARPGRDDARRRGFALLLKGLLTRPP